MTETGPLFLDCETKDGYLRMTTFAAALEPLLSDYAEWLQRNDCVPADVAYARIFRCRDLACIATLACEDGAVMLLPRRTYNGPFSKLIHTVQFELKNRWQALQNTIHGRRYDNTEEHVRDGALSDEDDIPPEEDDEE